MFSYLYFNGYYKLNRLKIQYNLYILQNIRGSANKRTILPLNKIYFTIMDFRIDFKVKLILFFQYII